MDARIDYYAASPESMRALIGLELAVLRAGLDPALLQLVKLRASQINGCAFCVYMHVQDAKAHGETDMRLFLLPTWRESPLFTDRERAALAWTESLTHIAKTGAPDADYELVKSQFTDVEISILSVMIGQINTWNRLQVAARAVHAVQPAVAAA